MLCPSWQWIKKIYMDLLGRVQERAVGMSADLAELSVKSDLQGSIEIGCDVGSGREK